MSLDAAYSVGSDRAVLVSNLQADYRRHRIGVGETSKAGPFPSQALDDVLKTQARIAATWNMTDAALQQLVAAYGANQLYSQHHDEPKTQSAIDAINDPNDESQRYRRNGIPELLTIADPVAWSANVDIYVPHHYMLDPDLFYWSKGNKVQDLLSAGKKVWSYTCCGADTVNIPSWMLDFDLIHFRIVPWLDHSSGFTGFLYWTPVNWCAADPWTNPGTSSSSCGFPHNRNLEGVLYYPGHKVGAPNAALPSARLKAIRDGEEDYEYLALLASLGDSALAATLSRTLAPAWNSWNHDPAALLAAREQAAEAIVKLTGGGADGGADGGSGGAGGSGAPSGGAGAPTGSGGAPAGGAGAHGGGGAGCGCRALARRESGPTGLWLLAGLAVALGLRRVISARRAGASRARGCPGIRRPTCAKPRSRA